MGHSMLAPEAQLLLAAAAGGGGAAGGGDQRLRALVAGPVDWELLGRLATRERALPGLRDRLVAAAGVLPAEAAGLQRLAMVAEFRMRHLEQRLLASLDALAARGIDVILLKGAALAATVYGSFVTRSMSDLDLLVRSHEAEAARAALLEAGWTTSEFEDMGRFYEGHQHLPALTDGQGTGLLLEVHTGLFFRGHPFRLAPDDLWRRARTVEFRGRLATVPAANDQLLHLCLHFAWSHLMESGAWRTFRDLDALQRAHEIDWDAFVRLARESRGGSCCYWTLRLARHLAGVPVPAAVMDALRPPLPAFALGRLERHFAANLFDTGPVCPSVRMGYTLWRMAVRPGWSGHGRVRPWDRSDDFLLAAGARGSGGRNLARQVRNARGWARYARLLLHG